MPGPTRRIAQPKKDLFLDAFRKCGSITQAAAAAGIGRHTHYDWLGVDAAYERAFRAAEDEAIEGLEDEARRRAFAGSDVLLIFLMKGAKPEKYRDRYEVTGKNGGPLEFDVNDTRKQLEGKLDRLLAESQATSISPKPH